MLITRLTVVHIRRKLYSLEKLKLKVAYMNKIASNYSICFEFIIKLSVHICKQRPTAKTRLRTTTPTRASYINTCNSSPQLLLFDVEKRSLFNCCNTFKRTNLK